MSATAGQVSDEIWAVPRGVTLLRHVWGDEAVVYNEASAQTHVLDAFSDWVLREIEDAPTTRAALGARAAALGLAHDVADARLAETLAAFQREGLAEPRRP